MWKVSEGSDRGVGSVAGGAVPQGHDPEPQCWGVRGSGGLRRTVANQRTQAVSKDSH